MGEWIESGGVVSGGKMLNTSCDSGGFVIRDLVSSRGYGNMEDLLLQLRNEGYERIEIIPTCCNDLIEDKLMKNTMLKGSALLVGRK